MFDEFDWGYAGTSKEMQIALIDNFIYDRNRGGRVVTSFHHGIVVDLEKDWPENEELKEFILSKCDNAIYFTDCNVGNIIQLKK